MVTCWNTGAGKKFRAACSTRLMREGGLAAPFFSAIGQFGIAVPRGLKPGRFGGIYVRAEARTLHVMPKSDSFELPHSFFPMMTGCRGD